MSHGLLSLLDLGNQHLNSSISGKGPSLPRAVPHVLGCGVSDVPLAPGFSRLWYQICHRVWVLSDLRGRRTFAIETSRLLGNSGPMVAADVF